MRISTPAILCYLIAEVYATQIPIRNSKPSLHVPGGIQHEHWELNPPSPLTRPPLNSTSHLVFNTVSSLLQHWPNTRYRNGHTIVPGTIPPGTLLYHGTSRPEVPAIPEWTATDPEHSYLFCRGYEDMGCWQLTLVTTRPLKVLYFDGTSAAKMEGGPMDTQDVLLWGEVKPEWIDRELQRIKELCDWGREFGIDGYVRMEMDFEVMLCDFTAGVEQVSFSNLATHLPPRTNSTAQDRSAQLWVTVLESGSWHNHFPGDTRIQLDLTRLVSFYDTSLAPSLVPLRHGKDRLFHRLEGIAHIDHIAVQKRLRKVFGSTKHGSGVDWGTLIRVIVQRHADRLELLQGFLNATEDTTPIVELEKARRIQSHLRIMLTPYLLHSVIPPPHDFGEKSNIAWATPVFKQCATTHLAHVSPNRALFSRLTESEHLIFDAVRETNREICRVIAGMWAEGVMIGIDPFLGHVPPMPPTASDVQIMLGGWREETGWLMRWLDWSVWLKCKPSCGFEEMCYLPTWPFLTRSRPSPPASQVQSPIVTNIWPDRGDKSEWFDPKPRCIRRVPPYDHVYN